MRVLVAARGAGDGRVRLLAGERLQAGALDGELLAVELVDDAAVVVLHPVSASLPASTTAASRVVRPVSRRRPVRAGVVPISVTSSRVGRHLVARR